MAFTNIKRQEEQANQQKPVTSNNAYGGLQGVNGNTANNLGNYQSGYNPSQTVQQRQQELMNLQKQKPQSFSSKYSAQLDNILGQINGQGAFKSDLASDPNWNYYLDLYTQKGKQAATDVQAQAAALTGGYGNSYGAAAGSQQYQQYLLDAYGLAPQFQQQQLAEWNANQQALNDKYAATADAYNTEYGQYRDLVGDWERDYDRANQGYLDERDFDYGDYNRTLDYWTNLAAQENKDYWQQQGFNEEQRQFEKNYDLNAQKFEEDKRQFDAGLQQSADQFNATTELNWKKLEEDQRQFNESLDQKDRMANQEMAANYVSAILANGQIPSSDLLVAAGLSYEDAQKLIAQTVGSAGGSGSTKTGNGNNPIGKDVAYGGVVGYNAGISNLSDIIKNTQAGTFNLSTAAGSTGIGTGIDVDKDKKKKN